MPYVNKSRPYKKEYQQQKERGENPSRSERQRARRALDAKGIDRKGKDVSHVKALASGGSNANGVTLQSPSENRSFARKSNHKPSSPLDKPKRARIIKV
jgi:hypothetical protein